MPLPGIVLMERTKMKKDDLMTASNDGTRIMSGNQEYVLS
jgi:hypothetical protein